MNLSVFDWDSANIGHIAEHDVTPEEVEDVLLGDSLDLNFQATKAMKSNGCIWARPATDEFCKW